MSALDNALAAALDRRRSSSTLRVLTAIPDTVVDFSSNDYLSLARNPQLRSHFTKSIEAAPRVLGSGSSRLLDGNSEAHVALEQRLAAFFVASAALLFNSGFDANVGIFSTVPQPGDAILYDELIHASVHDGMRASRANNRLPFAHNSVNGFRDTLSSLVEHDSRYSIGSNSVFVAVESLYSMDGDFCPLADLVRCLEELLPAGNGYLIVDEAHSTGICGPQGRGLVSLLGLESRVLVRVHTFGKALASAGAVVLTTPLLRSFLINYARPLIYSTALGYFNVISINCSFDILVDEGTQKIVRRLADLSAYCRTAIDQLLRSCPPHILSLPISPTFAALPSPIIPLLCPSPRPLASYIQSQGFMVRPITYPTVPIGQERIRICIHAANTTAEIDGLVSAIRRWLRDHQPSIRNKDELERELQIAKL